jgi:hypothetical protein
MSGLTLKQRRFVKHYVESGNGTESALVAYATQDPDTAHAIASENLRKPGIRHAVEVLLDAEGLSDRKLRTLLAHYLALYRSDDPREKALGLKALDMAFKLTGAYAPEKVAVTHTFDGWTIEELERFAESGEWPHRS